MYIRSFFSAPLSSLIMNHLWLSSHDEYSETHSDKGYYLQVIPLYRSVLLSKCTSIHSSLHPCLPLLWIISDCLLDDEYSENTWRPQPAYYKSFHCTYVSCCLNVHPFILLCTLVFPYYESSLIVFSWWVFRNTMKTPSCLLTSHSSTTVSCCLNVHRHSLLTSHSTIQKCSSETVFGDTIRQRLLLTSHSTVQKCSVV